MGRCDKRCREGKGLHDCIKKETFFQFTSQIVRWYAEQCARIEESACFKVTLYSVCDICGMYMYVKCECVLCGIYMCVCAYVYGGLKCEYEVYGTCVHVCVICVICGMYMYVKCEFMVYGVCMCVCEV